MSAPRRFPIFVRAVAVALAAAVVVMASGCPSEASTAEPGLGAFEGGFDPTRYDGGPLPDVDKATLGHPLRFHVPPFYADKLADGAAVALERYLEDQTHLDVEIRSPNAYDYAEITRDLASGGIDVAELSPYQYALVEAQGLAVIPVAATVAHGASTYGSYLVVRQGSPIHTLEDVKGKKVAFVDPLSTSGYLLPAIYLRAHGFDLDKDIISVFAGSHPAAVEAVRAGTVDVAAVSSDLLVGNAGLAGPLVVIAKAGRMPYDIIVARRDLEPKVLAQVRRALLRLSIHDERGRSALRAFSSVDGFMPVPAGHYEGVKALAREAGALRAKKAP